MNKITVLLVDDGTMFRDALHSMLTAYAHLAVVGVATNGAEAIRIAEQQRPNIVLMDVRMPVMDGVLATRSLRKICPECHVILLTTFDDDEYVFDGLRAGAVGYLLKDASSEDLLRAIDSAVQGKAFLEPSVAMKVVTEFTRLASAVSTTINAPLAQLSQRELTILRLIASGASNREIAQNLSLSEGTIKNLISSILSKLNARDRAHAAITAKELGLI